MLQSQTSSPTLTVFIENAAVPIDDRRSLASEFHYFWNGPNDRNGAFGTRWSEQTGPDSMHDLRPCSLSFNTLITQS